MSFATSIPMTRRRRGYEIHESERLRLRLPKLTHEDELLCQEIAASTGQPIWIVRRWMREQKWRQSHE